MPRVKPGGISITIDIGGDDPVEVTPADNKAKRDTTLIDS
jgi:hypothetical protein